MPSFKLFGKKKTKSNETEIEIFGGKTTVIDTNMSTEMSSKTTSLLSKLRQTSDIYDAIELLVDEHPDTSMAYSILLSLVNQGGSIEFSGNNTEEIQAEWEKFAQRVGKIQANGLEGIIYQLHSSDFLAGGMACEVVVTKDMSDIEDVYVVNPKTIKWELNETQTGYYPIQEISGKKFDLRKSNFLWIPFNPKSNNPQGTLLFRPVVTAADMQLEFFRSSQIVLYRVGSPRYKVVLDIEKIMNDAPPQIKNDVEGEKRQAYINKIISETKSGLSKIGVQNDFVITSDINVDTIGGNNAAFFQGISAYAELIDTQVMNALKVLGSLMNRLNKGGSYALSTVEFKVICDMLEPRQRAEKRIVESIARIWLQVKGYDATAKYTPNPIEWQTFKDKVEYKLKNLEYNRRSEEYGYIDADTAANNTNDTTTAVKATDGLYEYINKDLKTREV